MNKNEVLILEFEINDDSFNRLFDAIEASGLGGYVYRPSSPDQAEWPTMQSLIDAGDRLLVFAHGDGIQSCEGDDGACGDILYTFDYFAETEWGDVDTCDTRGNGNRDSAFLLLNHWENTEQ